MKLQIRARDARALLLLSSAALLYAVLTFAVLPAFDALKESSSGAAAKEEQLSRYRRALIRKGHYTQLLVEARKNVSEAEARLIRGDNPTLAAVELQTIVEEAARKAGLELNQRSISPARKKDEFFNEITMTLAFEATPAQVSGFLAEIRNGPKFVTVRGAQVAPIQVFYEAPKKGDFRKVLRGNLTLAAVLPVPVKKDK
ncbi:MAG TPA: type II secretion system protein GspM [Terriglobia bacterium]|nr:type II secretion system protein GspM [Terriglobia bacterium]